MGSLLLLASKRNPLRLSRRLLDRRRGRRRRRARTLVGGSSGTGPRATTPGHLASPQRELLALSGPRNPYPGKLGVAGKDALADLLVVNGDPIADIALLEKPDTNLAMIMKGGRIYKDIRKEDRWPRPQPKAAFSRFPPFIGAILKGSRGRVRKPDQDRAEVRFRRIFPLAAHPDEGRFT